MKNAQSDVTGLRLKIRTDWESKREREKVGRRTKKSVWRGVLGVGVCFAARR